MPSTPSVRESPAGAGVSGSVLDVGPARLTRMTDRTDTNREYSPVGFVSVSESDVDEKKPHDVSLIEDSKKAYTLARETFRLMAGHKKFPQIINAQSSLAADGSGVFRGFIPFDPILLSSPDYAQFANLFDEVTLTHAEVRFIPILSAIHASTSSGSSVTQVVRSIMAGVDRNAYSTSTTSYLEVLRLDGSQCLNRTTAEDAGLSIIRYKGNRPYASTAVPTTLDPPTGCVGVVRYAAASTLTASAVYFDIIVKLRLVFRNRV